MPGFDGTGPVGRGARTGRAMGRCAGLAPVSGGFGARGSKRGFSGFGRGFRGRGWFRGMGPSLDTPQDLKFDETSMLEQRLEALEEEIAQLKSRLKTSKS